MEQIKNHLGDFAAIEQGKCATTHTHTTAAKSSSSSSSSVMSSSAYATSNANQSGMSTGDVMQLGATILGFLMALVIIRFAFVIFLDCCVLDARDRAWQSVSVIWRIICPWWRPRTTPTEDENNNNNNNVSSGSTRTLHDLELQEMDLEDAHKLPECWSTLSSQDILRWRETQQSHDNNWDSHSSARSSDSSSNNNNNNMQLICSICLQELQPGNRVFTTVCCHIFHKACISEWMSVSYKDDCPYCRTKIISRATLERMMSQRRGQQQRLPPASSLSP
jgi:hypothetical protein